MMTFEEVLELAIEMPFSFAEITFRSAEVAPPLSRVTQARDSRAPSTFKREPEFLLRVALGEVALGKT